MIIDTRTGTLKVSDGGTERTALIGGFKMEEIGGSRTLETSPGMSGREIESGGGFSEV